MIHPYASELYARAFGHGYEPVFLPQAGCWVLKRQIPGSGAADAMGCYPLTPIAAGARLEDDFDLLRAQGVVSLVLVADPFCAPGREQLAQQFDLATPYKEHYLNDFSHPDLYDSKNHRYKVRRALRDCEVRRIRLAEFLTEWCALYDALIAKHQMLGIQAFSHDYFKALCELEPIAFGAFSGGELVSCQLWLEHGGYGYSHLVVSSERGYALRAAYALYDASLRYFKERGVRAVDLGGGAGATEASGGLAMLKKGFSTTSTMCVLCGKILLPDIYEKLSVGKDRPFFPKYRG
ncbi:MAG: GNAT family N-acetyltransferase [Alphaproteobacteria bacterium]|nr:GNAT family N-acetyltransferase [Alphaproteobacteria bacterium]